jgi:hypothetical protein
MLARYKRDGGYSNDEIDRGRVGSVGGGAGRRGVKDDAELQLERFVPRKERDKRVDDATLRQVG